MKRENIKTNKKDIIDYWFKRIEESELNVDHSEADKLCWRCGSNNNLERCHIVPHALGGKDEPSNLVLLCKRCHADGPNVTDNEIMWDWIKANKVSFYNTFWLQKGMEEYEYIYKSTYNEDVGKLDIESSKYIDIILRVTDNASKHFGQPYFNNATMAGLLRMSLKEYAKENNINLSNLDEQE